MNLGGDIVLSERIINRIYLIRNKKVMFDFDLAEMYDAEVRSLNQAVKRNIYRFPDDFMFQLNMNLRTGRKKFQDHKM